LNLYHSVLQSPEILGALGILLALFASSMLSFRSLVARLRFVRSHARDHVSARLSDGSVETSDRRLRVLEPLVHGLRPDVSGRRGARFVLECSLRDPVERWLEELRARTWGHLIGASYTGIALVFTFLLIALVLFQVSGAMSIGVSGDTRALSDAVKTMGGKFLISCTGLLLAIAHLFVVRRLEGKLAEQGWLIQEELQPVFVDRRAVVLELLDAQLEATHGLKPAIEAQQAAVVERLDRLRAIEVTVKDLGVEVSTSLAALVDGAMAQHVQTLLTDLRGITENIADKLEKSLQGNISALGERLAASIDGVQATIRAQPTSDLERIMSTFRDSVSGGFNSEAQNISRLLADFEQVFPTLAQELQQVTRSLGEVMSGLGEQQREQHALVASIATSTSENVQRMGVDFARGGSEAMAKILGDTNSRIAQMVAAMDQSAQRSAGQTSAIAGELDAVAQRVAVVASGLDASTGRVQSLLQQVEASLGASRNGLAVLGDAASRLKGASDGMQATISASDQARKRMESMLEQQVAVAASNAKGLDHMQRVWPQLLEDVAKTVQSTTGSLSDSWTKLSQQLVVATERYGNDVGAKVDDLGSAVELLTRTMREAAQPPPRR
jgi:ABC-type transporter Mla subunit MlaD